MIIIHLFCINDGCIHQFCAGMVGDDKQLEGTDDADQHLAIRKLQIILNPQLIHFFANIGKPKPKRA
jgi:hypothetical protein